MKYQLISTKVQNYNDQFVLKEFDIGKYKTMSDLKSSMLHYIDMFLKSFGHKTLTAELNEMQEEVSSAENYKDKIGCFEYKQGIPIYFWNLVLRIYNLEIRKWGN